MDKAIAAVLTFFTVTLPLLLLSTPVFVVWLCSRRAYGPALFLWNSWNSGARRLR
jgi:hypothetical protein